MLLELRSILETTKLGTEVVVRAGTGCEREIKVIEVHPGKIVIRT